MLAWSHLVAGHSGAGDYQAFYETLSDSHISQVVALHYNGWATFLWLGHWSNAPSSESIHRSHSNAENK
jgi:hypothetical protein